MIDALAAGRALAAQPATGRGVLDSAVGDVASHFDNSGGSGLVEGAARPRFVGNAVSFAVPGGGERAEICRCCRSTTRATTCGCTTSARCTACPPTPTPGSWSCSGTTAAAPVRRRSRSRPGTGGCGSRTSAPTSRTSGALGPNDTIDVVLHVHFSRDPDRSVVDVWRNGVPKVVDYHPPRGTLLDGGDYLKLGLYRDPAITQDSSMTTTRLVVGPTAASINATGITPR